MPELVLHPQTAASIARFLQRPSHALLIIGSAGSGKASTVRFMVGQILGVDPDKDSYDNHPYLRAVRPIDAKAIPIETVRELQKFISLRVPSVSSVAEQGIRPHNLQRAIIIEDAHLMTIEAQNALLKTLEEPPLDTLVILTVQSKDSVLPTIQSRAQELAILTPGQQQLVEYFTNYGYPATAVNKALMLSGGLPGLMAALLREDTEHPLVAATVQARSILQSKSYERLLLVDSLSKQKQLCLDVVFVLGQMARSALATTTDGTASRRWQRVMTASYMAGTQLRGNTQTKLILTNLMLSL